MWGCRGSVQARTASSSARGFPLDPLSLLTELRAPETVVFVAPSADDPADADAPVVPLAVALALEEVMGLVGAGSSSLSTKDSGMRAALQGAMGRGACELKYSTSKCSSLQQGRLTLGAGTLGTAVPWDWPREPCLEPCAARSSTTRSAAESFIIVGCEKAASDLQARGSTRVSQRRVQVLLARADSLAQVATAPRICNRIRADRGTEEHRGNGSRGGLAISRQPQQGRLVGQPIGPVRITPFPPSFVLDCVLPSRSTKCVNQQVCAGREVIPQPPPLPTLTHRSAPAPSLSRPLPGAERSSMRSTALLLALALALRSVKGGGHGLLGVLLGGGAERWRTPPLRSLRMIPLASSPEPPLPPSSSPLAS